MEEWVELVLATLSPSALPYVISWHQYHDLPSMHMHMAQSPQIVLWPDGVTNSASHSSLLSSSNLPYVQPPCILSFAFNLKEWHHQICGEVGIIVQLITRTAAMIGFTSVFIINWQVVVAIVVGIAIGGNRCVFDTRDEQDDKSRGRVDGWLIGESREVVRNL